MRLRLFIAVITLVLLTLMLASCDRVGWEPIVSGIWGSSTSNVFAVVEDGTVLHYNEGIWDQIDAGSKKNLKVSVAGQCRKTGRESLRRLPSLMFVF